MIRQRVSLAVAGAITAGTALTLGIAGPAMAANASDPTFTPDTTTDLVGVGSDTSQFALNYLAEGHGGVAGFNAGRTTGRIASFAADGTPTTVVLRNGHTAITRPNGSGAGKSLLYGAGNNLDVSFARSSSTLSDTEKAASLKQVPFAVDGLKLAVRSAGSNAPAVISATDMVKIYDGTYKTWGAIPGYTGPAASATIHALIPQPGSGTRTFFENQLKANNGGNAVTLSGVTETQEHSDVDIVNNPNAIAPFSTGRAKSTPTVALLGGFSFQRALYNVVRNGDLANPVLGNQLNDLFGEDGFVCSAAAKPLIAAAGFDQLATAARGGECGTFGIDQVGNFKTSAEGADATTTTLGATGSNGGTVTLKAAVSSPTNRPVGTVAFSEDGTAVGTASVAGGHAVLTLKGVAAGQHAYSATFTPTDVNSFTSSQGGAEVKVLGSSSVAVTVAPATRTYGAARLVTVSVKAGSAAASGAVSVKVGTTAAHSIALSGGVARLTIPAATTVGTRAVTATYSGSAAVYSSATSARFSVTKARTSTVAKLSAKKIKASKHARATFRVAIAGASSAVKASGRVVIKAGSKTVGVGTVRNGKVTVTLKKLKKGTYTIRATFGGSSNLSASKARAMKLKVVK